MSSQPKNLNEALNYLKSNVSYVRLASVALGFIIVGAVFYHLVEKLSWLDSFYFTTITLATVGYGDIVPHTAAGKLFTIFYVFFGITIFVALARIVLGGVAVHRSQHRKRR